MVQSSFEWDDDKAALNRQLHGVAFADKRRLIIIRDEAHSEKEERLFCIGKTAQGVLTVRFTMRGDRIRIIGAGKWRKWRKFYEEKRPS